MRIDELGVHNGPGTARASARVTWEDCSRPPVDIIFETSGSPELRGGANPHAFLAACLPPALSHGEKRLKIDDAICPELRNGLETAAALLCQWYRPSQLPVRIETPPGLRWPTPRRAPRAGLFLSGGIDSLSALRVNRLDFPLDHPLSVKDCIFVYGFDMGVNEHDADVRSRALRSVSAVADAATANLIAVATNIRVLDPSVDSWMYEFHGAAMAAVAHVLVETLSTVSIASSHELFGIVPYGTHPLLDPLFSSADMRIRHEGMKLSRLQKTQLVADWDVALQHVRVCTRNQAEGPNCGQCRKCIRTMTALLAIGKLGACRAFPVTTVSPDMLESVPFDASYEVAWYAQVMPLLAKAGRQDLVAVIQRKSAGFQRHLDWLEETDAKGIVKRLDRRYLGGRLARVRAAFKDPQVAAQQIHERRRAGLGN